MSPILALFGKAAGTEGSGWKGIASAIRESYRVSRAYPPVIVASQQYPYLPQGWRVMCTRQVPFFDATIETATVPFPGVAGFVDEIGDAGANILGAKVYGEPAGWQVLGCEWFYAPAAI